MLRIEITTLQEKSQNEPFSVLSALIDRCIKNMIKEGKWKSTGSYRD